MTQLSSAIALWLYTGSTTTTSYPICVRLLPPGFPRNERHSPLLREEGKRLILLTRLERAKGFAPSTPTLARLCSTPELHPHPCRAQHARLAARLYAANSA